jgi:hypothetical protein
MKGLTMKFLLLILMTLAASVVRAEVKIEEELFVIGQRPEVVRELIQSGSVIIDHVGPEGFEIYSSRGLSRYLDDKGISYFDMKAITKSVMADYPTHEEMTAKLQAAVALRPDIMQLFSIGRSVMGRELWVVKISDNVRVDEIEPEFKYISSMHGDEITGRELTTFLIEEIAQKYGKDREITELVNNTEIFIMPSMNPDGSQKKQRANAQGLDLNRNFPDITNPSSNTLLSRQPETQHVMKFQASRKFSLSANFHGGTIVVNYPWDSKFERHPLDAFVQQLSRGYAERNPDMRSSREFPGGIVNGADWYVVRGGMQDWSYFWFNDLQLTVELSHAKWPRYSDIPSFYRTNRDSMVYFMQKVHSGAGFKLKSPRVNGVVRVSQLSPVNRDLGSFSFSDSEFFKVLPEGRYLYSITFQNSKKNLKLEVDVDADRIYPNGNYVVIP